MSNALGADAVERFDGLANGYDRCRPDYPVSAIAFILHRCQLKPGMSLVDIGCGTGISARQFAVAGLRVIGIEPNAEMRRVAEAAPLPTNAGPIEYRDGRADATRLITASFDALLAAQAFHWFATDAALKEFYRILKQGGWVALMWNEQDRSDPFTAEYAHALIRHSPSPEIAADLHSRHGDILLRCPLFREAERVEFPNSQELIREDLLGRAFSASYAPREPEARRRLEHELTELFRQFRRSDTVLLRYRTVVFTARRPTAPTSH
jgi:ubiquinone/menaquinone biosynthesis C-methylase UbiE